MINLLGAFDLWRIVREVLVYGECEYKAATLIHALVRFDRECKIKDVIGIGKGSLHRAAERQFVQIYQAAQSASATRCKAIDLPYRVVRAVAQL